MFIKSRHKNVIEKRNLNTRGSVTADQFSPWLRFSPRTVFTSVATFRIVPFVPLVQTLVASSAFDSRRKNHPLK